ncbi:hypothetical protein BDK51DRAFT_41488 [Blyttiomyces helicus]|uniref:Uncharacterized protein n=1 Tax=Blyttiomyces helicus TaxID=388810 RepID=A0A4P9WM30_9FUNG|nr:hypothetical protein BDK51DRAFT_41488 [Blyttiomyces helicus]|eukprot:RKO92718.1 hypothetical protein BDK51DRAFT_41488 [Blyttiomyces helicus]
MPSPQLLARADDPVSKDIKKHKNHHHRDDEHASASNGTSTVVETTTGGATTEEMPSLTSTGVPSPSPSSSSQPLPDSSTKGTPDVLLPTSTGSATFSFSSLAPTRTEDPTDDLLPTDVVSLAPVSIFSSPDPSAEPAPSESQQEEEAFLPNVTVTVTNSGRIPASTSTPVFTSVMTTTVEAASPLVNAAPPTPMPSAGPTIAPQGAATTSDATPAPSLLYPPTAFTDSSSSSSSGSVAKIVAPTVAGALILVCLIFLGYYVRKTGKLPFAGWRSRAMAARRASSRASTIAPAPTWARGKRRPSETSTVPRLVLPHIIPSLPRRATVDEVAMPQTALAPSPFSPAMELNSPAPLLGAYPAHAPPPDLDLDPYPYPPADAPYPRTESPVPLGPPTLPHAVRARFSEEISRLSLRSQHHVVQYEAPPEDVVEGMAALPMSPSTSPVSSCSVFSRTSPRPLYPVEEILSTTSGETSPTVTDHLRLRTQSTLTMASGVEPFVELTAARHPSLMTIGDLNIEDGSRWSSSFDYPEWIIQEERFEGEGLDSHGFDRDV